MQTRFTLPQSDIPTHWYNLLADFPEPLPPPLHPGTKQPIPPRALLAIFPENLVAAGDEPGALDRDPRTGARHLRALAAHAAAARGALREGAANAGAHLLQIRRRQPRRQPQGQHLRRPGLFQQGGRHQAARHRNRRGPVGFVAGAWPANSSAWNATSTWSRSATSRSRIAGMLMHTWGATVHPSPSDQTEYGRKLLAEDPELPRQPRHRHQRSHRGHRQASGHEILARQRAESRLPAPDRHRPGSHQADGRWPAKSRTSSLAAAAAAAISPGWPSRSCRRKSRRRRNTASSASNLRLPVADQGRTALRFRRHGRRRRRC